MNDYFTYKLNDKQIELINKHMNDHEINSNNINILHIYKTKKYTLTIYKTKKMLIQGKEYQNILKMIGINDDNIENNKKDIDKFNIIGSDESGNGDFFGGVSVCACFINKNNYEKIINLGVKDSKELDDDEIFKIEEELKKMVDYKLIYVNPEQYNLLFDKFKNVNAIKTYLHNMVINELHKNHRSSIIVIDQFTNNNSFKNHLKNTNSKNNYEYILETKSESKYLQVACASILARASFVRELKNISKLLNLELPLGSVNSVVLPILKKINKNELTKICKTHFKTINKI